MWNYSTLNLTKNHSRNLINNSINDPINDSINDSTNKSAKNLHRNSSMYHLSNSNNNLHNNDLNSTKTHSHQESILTPMIIRHKKQPKPQANSKIFTKTEKSELESNFRLDPYPDSDKINELAMKLDKLPKQIRRWFKKQREKMRKQKFQNCCESIAHSPTSAFGPKTKLNSFCSDCPHCVVQAREGPVSLSPAPINPHTSRRSKSLDSISINSDDPFEIFCSIDCPSCLAPQNPVSVNPSTPSPIPTIHNPHPLATQSSSPCPYCKSIFKLVDQHFSDNSMTPHFETMDKLMHIPWSNTRPLMSNWPDTNDLYRRMNQNLDRFVNDLI